MAVTFEKQMHEQNNFLKSRNLKGSGEKGSKLHFWLETRNSAGHVLLRYKCLLKIVFNKIQNLKEKWAENIKISPEFYRIFFYLTNSTLI